MFATDAAGFDAQVTLLMEAVGGGFGCALGDGRPRDTRVGFEEKLMNREF